MGIRNILLIIVAVAVIAVSFSGVFILDETQQAIVTQFGKPVGQPRTKPGMNFKVPFIQRVQFFDKRFLEWDGDVNQVPTREETYILVDAYARWEITDPLQFYLRLRDERGGQSRLDDILDGETRNAVAGHDLLEVVRSTNREPEVTEEYMKELEVLNPIRVGRSKIEAQVLAKANERTSDLGIRILDFRFKRLNYAPEVRDRVYERMISERNRIADQFRSEGQGGARKIEGDKERDLAQIKSEALMESERIRGRADSTATAIYARAYNRTQASRDLYSFLKSMEVLEKSIDDQSSIILSTESDLYRYLKKMN